MKAVLYYTLIRRYMAEGGYVIMGVTSETGRNRLNGRRMDFGEALHTTRRDAIGKFEKLEDAQACNERVKTVWQKFDAERKKHDEAVRKLYAEERIEQLKILDEYPQMSDKL